MPLDKARRYGKAGPFEIPIPLEIPSPFEHNERYHRLLLRHVPRGCARALDVGCGTGRFARRLAARGITVDAVDASAVAIRQARATLAPTVRFWQCDITTTPLPDGHYDLITCLASVHHMPFGTVSALRAALAPGGMLLILGCYRQQWPADAPWAVLAVPLNAAARARDLARRHLRSRSRPAKPPVPAPEMTFTEIRRNAAELLPGSTLRRLLLWRYLLTFRR